MTRRKLLGAGALPGLALTPHHAAMHSGDVELGPDLANLDSFMRWVAAQNRQSMSFLSPHWKSLEEWKRSARELYLQRLNYSPLAKPLVGAVIERTERDGFDVEKVRISGTEAYDIPARLLLPRPRAGRRPGILALHCHSGRYVWGHQKVVSEPQESGALADFRGAAYGRPYAEILARNGYVVLAIDAFYFGERRLRPEEIDPNTAAAPIRIRLEALRAMKPQTSESMAAVNSLCWEYEGLTAKTIFAAGATWPGILVWDDRRALDYLVSRPEVDSAQIGCLGLSIGGLRSAYLAGADPRIKVACVTGWMTEFASQMRNHLHGHTWMVYVPGLYRSLDLPDIVGISAPSALLVQQCRRDKLYPAAAMESSVGKLSRIYAKAGAGERFRAAFHDVPHSFTPQMQDEAFSWFAKWL